ncbi:MAG: ABC transporter substrate-binding protein [Acidimicrobiales bacterium]|nr:ABC transporter substrate-binding protein [Acidimicrobiales bacterium]
MKRTLAVMLTAAALLAACGDDEAADTSDTTAAEAADASDEAVPERIVSMSPSATEMLFAIGAGDQVVAVDDFSNYPPDAPVTELSAYEPNVEAVATYDPDLVVVTDSTDLEAGLAEIDIDTYVTPAATTLDDTYEQITDLGELTGHAEEATDLVEEIKADIEELVAEVPEREEPLTYYHELDSTLFSVTSETFIGELYSLAGLENVADPADANGETGGYPQLSAEYLVDADPDLVFLADTKCCEQTAATFAARPGFEGLRAVADERVIALDDDIASRWGPRIVDFLRVIVDAVKAVSAA